MTTTLHGDFTDTTVIVTGSTRGIGKTIAHRFLREGAQVVFNGPPSAESLPHEEPNSKFIEADMADPGDIQRLIDETTRNFGNIDVLVNNAGVQSSTSTADATLEDWSNIVNVNFRAYWLTVKYALEHMPNGACVINITSNHAYATMPQHFPYNAIKAGVEGLTRAMAVDLSTLNIRANAIAPGWIRVQRTEDDLTPQQEQHLEDIHPTGRIGTPEDIAGTALWLASEDAAFVNGTSILVDGGRGAVLQDNRLAEYQ